ncbi:MAG: acyltransferase [Eubacteriales bacterium]|nr:acyltransferase [Eubacteriales bacterium]
MESRESMAAMQATDPQKTDRRTAGKAAELSNTAFVKLLAMLLVVYCHSISIYMPGGWGPEAPMRQSAFLGLVASWLNTFHVHTFVAVSGYLFAYLRTETHRYDSARHVLGNKAQRLLLPYVCASLFWVIPFDIRFWGFDATRLVKDYALALNPCQLWFLPMLFLVFCAFTLVSNRVCFATQTKKQALLWLAALYLIGVAANLASSFGVPNVFQWLRALQFLLFFYAGMLLRRYDLPRLYQWKYIIAALFSSVALFAFTCLCENAGGALALVRVPLRPVLGLCGALFLWLFGNKIARPGGTENGLNRLLSRTMFPVYLFHQQWIYLVIALLNRTGVAPYWLGETAFAASLILSVLLSWLLGKWKVTKRMFAVG